MLVAPASLTFITAALCGKRYSRSSAKQSVGFAIRTLGKPQKFQFAVQRRALHADKGRGARDIARKTVDLDAQIFAFEIFARFLERDRGDRFELGKMSVPPRTSSAGSMSASMRLSRSLGARIITRSITLRSSRTFPGHSCAAGRRHRFRADLGRRDAAVGGVAADIMIAKAGDIVAPLAERQDMHRHDVEPVMRGPRESGFRRFRSSGRAPTPK